MEHLVCTHRCYHTVVLHSFNLLMFYKFFVDCLCWGMHCSSSVCIRMVQHTGGLLRCASRRHEFDYCKISRLN